MIDAVKPLGWKKTRTRVACHSDCAVCHPGGKGGRAHAKRATLVEVADQLDSDMAPAEWRLLWLECDSDVFDVSLTPRGTAHARDLAPDCD